jgi:hypothetical protein
LAGVRLDGEARRRGSRSCRRGSRTAAAARLLHQAPAVTPTAAEILRNAAARACSNWMIPRERSRVGGWEVVLRWCALLWRRRGGFYRLGRGRELGFPEVAGAGKFSGRGGSVDDVRSRGRVVGDAAPPLACWRRSLTSAMARRRACWSGDREVVEELFLYPPARVWASPTGDRQRRGRGRRRVR